MTSQCGLIQTTSLQILHQLQWAEEVRSWSYAVAMFSAARGHRREYQMPSLMDDMYGFASTKEEMSDTKDYLRVHGNYQLEQVSVT